VQAPALAREHRLYQADWLLQHYGYGADEIVAPLRGGQLDLDIDPKLAWALAHREAFPVDVNAAERAALLRVPGLGVRNVKRLLALRRQRRVRYADLVKLRCDVRKAEPFVVTVDHRPRHATLATPALRARLASPARQLPLL
jgi:predicted DNA-binding helix-hairpin-helix protein